MNYTEWKENNTKKLNSLDLIYAISKEELQKELNKRNLVKDDLMYIDFGTYTPFINYDKFIEINKSIKSEKKVLFNDFDFMYSAFYYQFYNTEYCITYDTSNALDQLDLTIEKIKSNSIMTSAYNQAKKDYQVKHEMY